MGIQGKRTPPTIEEFVVKTKQNAPGLTHQNIVDRVVEQFGESSRIDRSSVPRILARAGLQEPTREGATANQGWDTNGSVYYQGADRQLDRFRYCDNDARRAAVPLDLQEHLQVDP